MSASDFTLVQELNALGDLTLPENYDDIRELLELGNDVDAAFDSSFESDSNIGSACSSPVQSAAGSPLDISDSKTDVSLDDADESDDCFAPQPKQDKLRRLRKSATAEERLRRQGESKVRRNERERRRVRRLAEGFVKLRGLVPNCEDERKTSKLDTLRSTLEYMSELSDMIARDDIRRNREELQAQQTVSSNMILVSGIARGSFSIFPYIYMTSF